MSKFDNYQLFPLSLQQNTVDKLVQRANASLLIGTSSWKEQFVEALTVNAGKLRHWLFNWVNINLSFFQATMMAATKPIRMKNRHRQAVWTTSCTSSRSFGKFFSHSSRQQVQIREKHFVIRIHVNIVKMFYRETWRRAACENSLVCKQIKIPREAFIKSKEKETFKNHNRGAWVNKDGIKFSSFHTHR